MKTIWEDKRTMGDNPASVDMADGTIILNKDVFPKYSKLTQSFIIEHEKGHYNLRTDNENEADSYALHQVYGKYKKSLKGSLNAIGSFLPENDKRIKQLYIEALKIDAEKNNNEKAKKELNNLTENNMGKLTNMYSPFVSAKRINNMVESETNTDTDNGNSDNDNDLVVEVRKEKIYNIFGFHLSLGTILILIGILLILIRK